MESTVFDENLNIKPHKSRASRKHRRAAGTVFTYRTIEEDIASMREYAAVFDLYTVEEKIVLLSIVHEGQTIDYYKGAYDNALQMFTIAFDAKQVIAPTLMQYVHCISRRIVDIYK